MDFSRLDDTKFPNLETAAPYALKNTFDYTRWVPNTKIHLVNVLWNNDYSNVVKFTDDAARDAWFDSIADSYVVTLTSNARMVPDGSIKLPLPYDVAASYNYMYVEIPLATSSNALIQNETNNGIRRWYFFIGDIDYSAPNTTICMLQLDVWTTYINESSIQYMMLRRGHAPVANTDTDTYLANPIANNKYLLAPDVNYDDSDVVRDSTFIPFGNGKKWVCFASTIGPAQMLAKTYGETTGDVTTPTFSDPTFSDTSDWYGYQLQVNGFGFGDSIGMSSLNAPVNQYARAGAVIPNNLAIYAVDASDENFFLDVSHKAPTIMRTIKAFFILDDNMLTIDDEYTFDICGHTAKLALNRSRDVGNYSLSKDMFGFDSDEQRFAKLFTYPYSRLEVSDNDGKTVEIRIENTGTIGIHMLSSVLFPVLDCRVFLSGINGVGSQSYTWKNLNQADIAKQLPNGDWDKTLFQLNIPTYAIYMSAETAWLLDNYSSSLENGRRHALAAYHNSVRSANSDYTNSVASADTAQTNANASAATAQTNANASATTTRTNSNNLAQCNSDNVNLVIAQNDANTARAILAANRITGYGATRSLDSTNAANSVSFSTTVEENQTSIATTKATGAASVETGAVSGFTQGAMQGMGEGITGFISGMALGLAGAISSGYSAGISAQTANDNASIVAQTNSTVTALNSAANTTIRGANTTYAAQAMTEENACKQDQQDNTDTSMAGQRDNNYNTNTTNATNLYNTQTANSGRTYNTSTANSGRTHTTSTANSTRSRQVQVLNAQELLKNAQYDVQGRALDASRGTPIEICPATGEGWQWSDENLGIQFRLRTQSDSAIAQTAAQFARYGYQLNQLWDVKTSGLNLMKNFTYWQADDIWVDVRNTASAEVGDLIGDMFRNGVTVWSNPERIGKVGIYDN